MRQAALRERSRHTSEGIGARAFFARARKSGARDLQGDVLGRLLSADRLPTDCNVLREGTPPFMTRQGTAMPNASASSSRRAPT